jgi:hypothetical protein
MDRARELMGQQQDSGVLSQLAPENLRRRAADTLSHVPGVSSLMGQQQQQPSGMFSNLMGQQQQPSSGMFSNLMGQQQQPSSGYSAEDLRRRAAEGLSAVPGMSSLMGQQYHPSEMQQQYMQPHQAGIGKKLTQSVRSTLPWWLGGIDTSVPHRVREEMAGTEFEYNIQSRKIRDGMTITYMNHNGDERVDIYGQDVHEGHVDKLSILNDFRRQHNLMEASSLGHAKFNIHQVARPQLLLRSARYIDGVVYRYCFDDGKENVEIVGQPQQKIDELQLLNSFRQSFGLSPLHSMPRREQGAHSVPEFTRVEH